MKKMLIIILSLFLICGCVNKPITDNLSIDNIVKTNVINEIKLPEGYHKDRVEVFYIDEQYTYISLYFEEHYKRFYKVDRNNNVELIYEFYLSDNGDECHLEYIDITGSYIVNDMLYLCYWNNENHEYKVAYVDNGKLTDIYHSPEDVAGLYIKYICEEYAILHEIQKSVDNKNEASRGDYIKKLDFDTNESKLLLDLKYKFNIKTGEILGDFFSHYYQSDKIGFFYVISNNEIEQNHYFYDIEKNETFNLSKQKEYDCYYGNMQTKVLTSRELKNITVIRNKNNITEEYKVPNNEKIILEEVFEKNNRLYLCGYNYLMIYNYENRSLIEYNPQNMIKVYNDEIYIIQEINNNDHLLKIEKIEENKEAFDENKVNITQLIDDIKNYNNGYSDKDYESKELCLHPRGEYEKDDINIEIWSEPHIYNIYYMEIKGEDYSSKMYFNQDDYSKIQKILEAHGFIRLPE